MKNNELQELLKNRNGLKFNLNDASNKKDILFRTLELRGIENLDGYKFPKANKDFTPSNPFKLFNGSYWSKYVIQKAQEQKDFYIIVDNDADGFSSSSLLYMYLKTVFKNINIKFIFTEGKTHGIHNILTKLIQLDNAFVLIPDASIPIQDQKSLMNNDIEYLIIDHHDLEDEDKIVKDYLPIFNNQFKSNKTVNRELTGVGMAYELCKMLDYYLNIDVADSLLYFVSIGQIGDVSDVSDLEIRNLVLKGFKTLNNNLILRYTTDINKLSAHELSFSIIPKINAVCRTGSIKEKELLMNGLVGNYDPNEDIEIKVRRKSKVDNKFHYIIQTINQYNWVARKLNSIKSRQNRTVKKSIKLLTDIRENRSFIVALDKQNKIPSTENGLLATQLANKYQKPAMVLHTTPYKNGLGGSARGFDKVMKDFKEFCLSTKLFTFCAGHPNAFGLAINEENLEKLLNNFDYDYSEDSSYDVDNIYVNEAPGKQDIIDFDNNRMLFGGKVTNPKLGFIGLDVGLNNMRFRGSVLSFKFNGISFTKFNASNDLKEKLMSIKGQNVYLDIVGTPNINNYMKINFPQIIIDDIKIVDSTNSKATTHSVDAIEDFLF